MNIGWPEGIFFFLLALNFAMHCQKAGEPRHPYSPVGYLFDATITVGLLYWGGFFA